MNVSILKEKPYNWSLLESVDSLRVTFRGWLMYQGTFYEGSSACELLMKEPFPWKTAKTPEELSQNLAEFLLKN